MPALIPLLLGIAPTVADWIFGDRTGKAVGQVSEIAKSVLGTDDPGAIERAIAADPNLALQFKQAIIQAAADARRVELDSFRAQLADVQSARTQTVDLAKANTTIAWGAPIISTIVLAAFGGSAMGRPQGGSTGGLQGHCQHHAGHLGRHGVGCGRLLGWLVQQLCQQRSHD